MRVSVTFPTQEFHHVLEAAPGAVDVVALGGGSAAAALAQAAQGHGALRPFAVAGLGAVKERAVGSWHSGGPSGRRG